MSKPERFPSRLDDYIAERIDAPERIAFIKIDLEGFEFSLLQGLERFFASSTARPLICMRDQALGDQEPRLYHARLRQLHEEIRIRDLQIDP